MSNQPLRVLVVDDTVIYRKIVSDILGEIPGVEVVGVAHNGKAAVSKRSTPIMPAVVKMERQAHPNRNSSMKRSLSSWRRRLGAECFKSWSV